MTLVRKSSPFLLALVLSLCLPGCVSEQSRATDAAGRPVLTWMLPVDLDRPLYEEISRAFRTAHPEIDLRDMWVTSGQYQTKLKTLIAADQAPDLFRCGDVWVAYLRPFLYDVTRYVRRDAGELDLADFYPQVLAASQYHGRYYYLPTWFNVSLLYYNKTLFDENGVPYPTPDWTWRDYVRAGQRLTYTRVDLKDGRVLKVPYGARVPANPDQVRAATSYWGTDMTLGWWGEWLIYVRQAGGALFDPTVTRCTLDTPAAISGLSFYADRITRDHIAPPIGFGPPNGFASGKMAMLLGGHVGNWVTYNKLPDLDWDIQVLPRGPKSRRGGELAMDAWGISRTCRHPDAAWTFLKFLTSKDGIRRQVRAGHLSVRKSVTREMLGHNQLPHPEHLQAAYAAMGDGVRIPQSPDYIEIALDVIQPEIDLMLQGHSPPAQAAHKATRAANAFIRVLGQRR